MSTVCAILCVNTVCVLVYCVCTTYMYSVYMYVMHVYVNTGHVCECACVMSACIWAHAHGHGVCGTWSAMGPWGNGWCEGLAWDRSLAPYKGLFFALLPSSLSSMHLDCRNLKDRYRLCLSSQPLKWILFKYLFFSSLREKEFCHWEGGSRIQHHTVPPHSVRVFPVYPKGRERRENRESDQKDSINFYS